MRTLSHLEGVDKLSEVTTENALKMTPNTYAALNSSSGRRRAYISEVAAIIVGRSLVALGDGLIDSGLSKFFLLLVS